MTTKERYAVISAVLAVAVLSSCGGSSSSQPPPPPPPVTYTIGGTVIGLSGSGLTLQDNGRDNLQISANGTFTFVTAIDSGSKYNVTVLTQPATPAQNCTVTNNSATVTANVTNVEVVCVSDWIWVDGLTVASTYGPGGSTPPGNYPGAREDAETWTDPQGNFWLYGGDANYAVTGGYAREPLSDLWEYKSGQWTLVSGTNAAGSPAVWGQMGVADPGNTPGPRENAATWTDASGNIWLFGGANYNDLWKFTPSTSEWTWICGSNLANQSGTYGTMGTADPANIPGQRFAAVGWADPSGNFWLFGGMYWISTGVGSATGANYSDLWEYNPSSNQWTWMSGSNQIDQAGTYGTEGIASSGNAPGGRFSSVSWTDSHGNLWLFGGYGAGGFGGGTLNDLWMYSGGQWTWMGGSTTGYQPGVYGTQGVAAAGNTPGARTDAFGWTDKQGNLWLFGGLGTDSTGTAGWLNDFWEYQP